MQSNADVYVIVKHWLTFSCPYQYRSGDGLPVEIALYVTEYIENFWHGIWSFESLDAAIAAFKVHKAQVEQSRSIVKRVDVVNGDWENAVVTDVQEEQEEIKAQDCVFLWQCGVMADF